MIKPDLSKFRDDFYDVCKNPAKHYVAPFKIVDDVYSVSSTDAVNCFLIDCGGELALIDTAFNENVPGIKTAAEELGFDVKNISTVFLTHAHADHINGAKTLKDMTGASVYLAAEDLGLLCSRELLYAFEEIDYIPIIPDKVYDGCPIKVGNKVFRTALTPGHTPGTTSFFFETDDSDFGRLTVGLCGGLGLNTLRSQYMNWYRVEPSQREKYLTSMKWLNEQRIDVTLISHNGIVDLAADNASGRGKEAFVGKDRWQRLTGRYLERITELIETDPLEG